MNHAAKLIKWSGMIRVPQAFLGPHIPPPNEVICSKWSNEAKQESEDPSNKHIWQPASVLGV